MNNGDRDSFTTFIQGIIGFPSAVYNRGSEHGQEWTRIYRGDKTQNEQREPTSCPYTRHDPPVNAQVGDGNGDDSDDWMYRVAKDLEKSEERARMLYSTWKQEEDLERKRLEEETKKQQQKPERTPRPWWGGRCQRATREDQGQFYGVTDRQRQNDSQDSEATPPAIPPIDFDSIRRDFERKWQEWDKDMDQFVRDANSWRKQWFKDDSLWPGSDLFGADTPFSRPLSSLFALGMAPAFLRFQPDSHPIGYLLYSPYSPLALEKCQGFDKNWRNRFEDLLRAEEGKELMTEEEMENANNTTGMTWVMKRVLPLLSTSQQYPKPVLVESDGTTHQPHTNASDEHAEPATEHDMYEARSSFFGDVPRESAELPVGIAKFDSRGQLPKPDVLSTLTTTERHMAPDGSVTTKTVLKRRFSDGREETEEKIETSKSTALPDVSQQQRKPAPLIQPPTPQETQRPSPRSTPKRGWFWSS